MFSSACALPSPTSAEGGPSLFGWFIGVGSEVAHLRAGHRPPPKPYVQFSRIRLSRRLTLRECQRRNQPNQVHKPVLSVQLRLGQLFPTRVSPSVKTVCPDAMHDPAIETVEKLSDVGPLVIMPPTPQNRIQSLNQLLGRQRHASLGKLAYLIHEVSDRFLTRVGIQRPRSDTTTNLARGQPKLLLTALDLVSQKLESLPDMHY